MANNHREDTHTHTHNIKQKTIIASPENKVSGATQ